MKKIFAFSTILMVLLMLSPSLLAQTESRGDTLLVGPLNSEGQPLGALNEAIKADTSQTGERLHKVYKLQHNAQYILTETIQADFPLIIVADEPDDANRPPVIRCGLKEDGSSVDLWWNLYDGATFKNIWMSGINLDGTGPISWISQVAYSTGKRYVYDGCIIEFPYTWWSLFIDWGLNNTYIFTNNVCQYIGNPTNATWNGAVFSGGTMDTVIHRNNTFYDFGAFAFNGQAYYLELDHNTYVNCMMHPIMSHSKVIGKYTNNLFVNGHAFSDDYDEIRRHHDVEVKGLMNYAEVQWDPNLLDSLYGPGGAYGKDYDPNGDGVLTEGELVWELKNNNWWYTQPVKDYWDQFPEVVPNPWMNNYNQAMFDSHDLTENWTWDLKAYIWADSNDVIVPNPSSFDGLHVVDSTVVPVTHEPFSFFVEENTMNEDPGITDMNGTDELLAQNCINIRTEWGGGTVSNPVNFHGVSDYLAFTWPLDYDLSYTNTALQTASTDGKQVGSLQWWGVTVDVANEETTVPNAFALEQNYPNPFNPSTKINYSVPNNGFVTLKVCNILGQEIATLFSGQLQAGNYVATFDGSKFSSGVYIYRLESEGNSISKKLIIMK